MLALVTNFFNIMSARQAEPTADAPSKSVSFNFPKGRTNSGLPTEPQETTGPTPPTSILKQKNSSDILPQTVSMLTTATNWLSSFYSSKPNTANKSTQTSEDGSMAGKRKAPEPSDGNHNKAKGAKTEMSPEEREAMQSLINKEVIKRGQKDNRGNFILDLQHQERLKKEEVKLEFEYKFKIRDSDFMERLEQEIKALASLKERAKDAFSFRSNPDGEKGNPGKNKPGTETPQPVKEDITKENTSGEENPWVRKGKFIPILETHGGAFKKQKTTPELAEKKEKSNALRKKALDPHLARHNARVATYYQEVYGKENKALESAEALLRERGQASSLDKSAPSSGLQKSGRLYHTQDGPLNDTIKTRNNKAFKSKIKNGDIVVEASGHGHRESLRRRFLTNPTPQERGH